MTIKLSKSFTFEELTDSKQHPGLVLANRAEAAKLQNIVSLTTLALTVLQPLRDAWGHPLTVNSGFRDKTLNKAIGGAHTSQHLLGQAADIDSTDNYSLWELAQSLMTQGTIHFGQCILEKGKRFSSDGWLHISLPSDKHSGEVLTYDGKSYSLVRKIPWTNDNS